MLQKFIQAAWELGEGPPSTRCPSVDLLEGDGDHALPWESVLALRKEGFGNRATGLPGAGCRFNLFNPVSGSVSVPLKPLSKSLRRDLAISFSLLPRAQSRETWSGTGVSREA